MPAASASTKQLANTDQAAHQAESHEQVPLPVNAPIAQAPNGQRFDTPPEDVNALQNSIGNRAVSLILQRKCAGCASGGASCTDCAEEDSLLQRSAVSGASRSSQNGSAWQSSQSGGGEHLPQSGGGEHLPSVVTAALGGSGGRGLDGQTRAFVESRFGHSFGHVRIHADETAARAADALDATAFTVGNSIWFGRGQYQTGDAAGLHLLAHELTHTIQQRNQPPTTQASLRVGSAHDPSESAADRAADAVLANQPVARLGVSSPAIRRVPKVDAVPGNPQQRIVTLDNKKQYRVTQTIYLQHDVFNTEANAPHVKPHIDDKNVWLQLDMCSEGKHGDIKTTVSVGANAPEAAKKLADELRAARDPLAVLKRAELEPFVSVKVAQSGGYSVEGQGGPTLRPVQGDVTGGKARLEIKGPGGTGVFVEANKDPSQTTITGGVTGTFGKPAPFTCEHMPVKPTITYQCEEFVPAKKEPRERKVPRTPVYYRYFNYAKPEFSTDPHTAAQDKAGESAISQALMNGYHITNIRGFASPEGSLDPNPRTGWIGNRALAGLRAKAVEDWIDAMSRSQIASSYAKGYQRHDKLHPEGEELYGKTAEGTETQGKEVARVAVGRFKTEPAEESRRTPEVMEQLERARTPERQKDVALPQLRRAEITLTGEEPESYIHTEPERYDPPTKCSEDVLAAAKEAFEGIPGLKF
jgi:hypothetical protein